MGRIKGASIHDGQAHRLMLPSKYSHQICCEQGTEVNSSLIDESPLVEAFRNAETIAHLESLIRLEPEAESWLFEVACSPMGDWIEERPGTASHPRWSAQWPTETSASAFERLTPMLNVVVSLSSHLSAMQHAHTEAVGGPLDGVGYHVVAYRDHTVLSLLY